LSVLLFHRFTESVTAEIAAAIAHRAGVEPSAVQVVVSAGSVILHVEILTLTASSSAVLATMAAATSDASQASAMLSSVTSVPIVVLAIPVAPSIVALSPPGAAAPPADGSSGGGSSSTGLIIGIVVGAVALICLAVCLKCFWSRGLSSRIPASLVKNAAPKTQAV